MSQQRIAKLEALLARVGVRRAEPRLKVLPAAAEPAPLPLAAAAPAPTAADTTQVIMVPDAEAIVGNGAPPTPSVMSALDAIRPEHLDEPELAAPAASGSDFTISRPAPRQASEAPADSLPMPSELPASEPPPLDEPVLADERDEVDEPDEPTVAVTVPAITRAVHPELTSTGVPTVPELDEPPSLELEPEPLLELSRPLAPPAPEPARVEPAAAATPPSEPAAPEPAPVELPRVSVPPVRMSLPVRPSLPSPELVPEALPFTLLTERPPALPSEQESLELAAIALSTAQVPVIDLGSTGPVRVEMQPASSGDVIEVDPTASARASIAVTVVPGASSAPAAGPEPVIAIIPPARAPVLDPAAAGAELEPEPEPHAASGSLPEPIRAALPSLTGSAVQVTSELKPRAPRSFGRLLERSLALRPRG